MRDEERAEDPAEQPGAAALLALVDQKLDTVAGATAAIATTQNDLLARLADVEARRGDDARDVAQRLDALERQVLALSQAPAEATAPLAFDDAVLEPLRGSLAELTAAATSQRDDLALALDVLARMAEALERSDARTEDRLAAVRDAAAIPIADLQTLLTARADRSDSQLGKMEAALEGVLAAVGTPSGASGEDAAEGLRRLSAATDRTSEGMEQLGEAVRSLSWQLPEITEELAALRERVEGLDLAGPVATATDELGGQLTLHTDTALAGILRLIDERLNALRKVITEPPAQAGGQGAMGFEAGAVMGAAQAAWTRLEQRLDTEFDDLSHQLQSMGVALEQALATAEAAANRPVVTGDQLRRAVTSWRDTILGPRRPRRDRFGGPPSLGPGGTGR